MKKNIAIIGAGFTGLSAGYYLTKAGYTVTLYEQDSKPGGLAIGYRKKKWKWSLEHHYHHWFTNDTDVLGLANEVGYPVQITRPKTSVFVSNQIYQLDSPKHLLSFTPLPIRDRLRTAMTLAALRFNPYWKHLEQYNAEEILRTFMGQRAYDLLWRPQLHNKFGTYASDISLAWFWARIVKRTPSLAYPEKGYLNFAEHLVRCIEKQGGTITLDTPIDRIVPDQDRVQIHKKNYDATIVTLPNVVFSKITPSLPQSYHAKLQRFNSIGAVNLILRLRAPFFSDTTYWLSVCQPDAPIMAIVEHTNFMDRSHYNGEHIVYVANYADRDSTMYAMSDRDRLKLYDPFLKKINPDYRKNIIGYDVFKAPFAQPIIPPNYSSRVLPIQTPAPRTYLANMQQVYPWDRGTNYAVELGKRAANAILESHD